jgi:putative spermidine/putrescine transport system ATP-binding protein
LPVKRDGQTVTHAGTQLTLAEPPPDGERLSLIVRPERVKLVADSSSDKTNRFAATVADIDYQGDSYLMYATLADGAEISVRGVVRSVTLAALPSVGAPVTLSLEPEDTVLIADVDGTDRANG